MSEIIPIDCYGLHRVDDDIAFLEQEKGGSNAVGLAVKSPFKVTFPRHRHCNHRIPLAAPVPEVSHVAVFQKIYDDPVVQAMLPIPHEGIKVFYVNDPTDALAYHLVSLAKLSNPVRSVVNPVWGFTSLNPIIDDMKTTNVQPLVLTHFKAKDTEMLGKIAAASAYAPRVVICTGAADVVMVPKAMRIETKLLDFPALELLGIDMVSIGAWLIRAWMRKEWKLGAPLPDPLDAKRRREARARGEFR